ncbi:hypothetical protein ACVTMZ_20165 [Escherichia coli]
MFNLFRRKKAVETPVKTNHRQQQQKNLYRQTSRKIPERFV